MARQFLFFDLDDTLIHCNKYFNETLVQFARWMKGLFPSVSREAVLKKQLEFDLEGVRVHGFKKERFPLSLIETYRHYMEREGRHVKADHVFYLYDLGYDVYNQEYEPYPHMEETLLELRDEGHTLSLFTGGDETVQRVKIDQLGLRRYFGERVFIAQHKNTEAFRAVLHDTGADLRRTWMTGNSARTDMIPALEAGAHAIFIPNDQEWAYNEAEINIHPQGVFVRLESLREVPDVIRKHAAVDGPEG